MSSARPGTPTRRTGRRAGKLLFARFARDEGSGSSRPEARPGQREAGVGPGPVRGCSAGSQSTTALPPPLSSHSRICKWVRQGISSFLLYQDEATPSQLPPTPVPVHGKDLWAVPSLGRNAAYRSFERLDEKSVLTQCQIIAVAWESSGMAQS